MKIIKPGKYIFIEDVYIKLDNDFFDSIRANKGKMIEVVEVERRALRLVEEGIFFKLPKSLDFPVIKYEETKKLHDEFNKIREEREYSFYLSKLKDRGVLYLDNDDTFFIFDEDDQDNPKYLIQFSYYLGNSLGIITLLEALNVRFEGV